MQVGGFERQDTLIEMGPGEVMEVVKKHPKTEVRVLPGITEVTLRSNDLVFFTIVDINGDIHFRHEIGEDLVIAYRDRTTHIKVAEDGEIRVREEEKDGRYFYKKLAILREVCERFNGKEEGDHLDRVA